MKRITTGLKANIPDTDEVWQHDSGDHYRIRELKEVPSAEIAQLMPNHVKRVITVACCHADGDVVECECSGRHVIFGKHELYLDPAPMRARGESPEAQRQIHRARLIERARRIEIARRNLEPLIVTEASEWERLIPTAYGVTVRVRGHRCDESEYVRGADTEEFVSFKLRMDVLDEHEQPVVDAKGTPFTNSKNITLPLAEITDHGDDELAVLAEKIQRPANELAIAAANYLEEA